MGELGGGPRRLEGFAVVLVEHVADEGAEHGVHAELPVQGLDPANAVSLFALAQVVEEALEEALLERALRGI